VLVKARFRRHLGETPENPPADCNKSYNSEV